MLIYNNNKQIHKANIKSTKNKHQQQLVNKMNDYQDLTQLENSVAHAGNQLYNFTHRLHEVERSLDNTNATEMDDLCVLELLESMTEVKNEYQNLRKDIQEVQQLQRDVTTSIRYQMHSMQKTFQMLKKRIEMKANVNNQAQSNHSGSGNHATSSSSSAQRIVMSDDDDGGEVMATINYAPY